MAKLGFIQSIIAIIKNISNQLIKIDHKQRLYICLLITILIASILFKLFFWQNYQEGIDDTVTKPTIPQSNINITFTDKATKPSTQQYEIYTQYDTAPYSTFAVDPSGANVKVTMVDGAILTIKPVQDSSSNIASFPKSMEIKMFLDKKGPVYYLKNQLSTDKKYQNTFSKTNPGEINIYSISVGGFILNLNYEQIGSMVNDNFNPYLYTVKFKDTTEVGKINIHLTTSAP